MEKTLVKDEHYVGLQGWMIKNLELKGNELIIFAIIYGFSQGEQGVFNGSLQYLADWTNSTKQGVIKNIKNLIEKGLIIKNEVKRGCIKYCEYSSKFNGVKQSLIVDETKFNRTVKQSLPNNIVNTIEEKYSTMYDSEFEIFWKKYPRHDCSKQMAKKSYISTIKNNKATPEVIIDGLDKYCKQIKRSNTENKFIKHAATWLNNQCWNDEYEIEPSKPQTERREPTEEELLEFRRKRLQEIAEWNERNKGR